MLMEAAIAEYKAGSLAEDGYFASFDDAVKSLPEELIITLPNRGPVSKIEPYDSYGYTIASITGVGSQTTTHYPTVDVIVHLRKTK